MVRRSAAMVRRHAVMVPRNGDHERRQIDKIELCLRSVVTFLLKILHFNRWHWFVQWKLELNVNLYLSVVIPIKPDSCHCRKGPWCLLSLLVHHQVILITRKCVMHNGAIRWRIWTSVKVVWRIFAMVHTVSELVMFQFYYLENLGQGDLEAPAREKVRKKQKEKIYIRKNEKKKEIDR